MGSRERSPKSGLERQRQARIGTYLSGATEGGSEEISPRWKEY